MHIKKIKCYVVKTNHVAQGREMNTVIKYSVATKSGFLTTYSKAFSSL